VDLAHRDKDYVVNQAPSAARPRVYNVLFLCTGNSARSIIAEALMNHLGGRRFHAYSAGSFPTGRVHPLALEVIADLGPRDTPPRSKRWDEFALPDAPVMDFVFTVCDNAAGEVCPQWPGQPMTAHWGIEDPSYENGSEADKRRAFELALLRLKRRIELFLSLPLESIDSLALQQHLKAIGITTP
jgi:protein-tyrosine-phosphatase